MKELIDKIRKKFNSLTNKELKEITGYYLVIPEILKIIILLLFVTLYLLS